MNPNDVNELLRSLINEFALPITSVENGPLLISEDDNSATRSSTEEIIRRWKGDEIADKLKNFTISGHWRLSRGCKISDIYDEVEHLASNSTRIAEVKEVLRSLIKERELPFNILHLWFTVVVLPDNPMQFRTDDMIELDTLLERMTLEGCFGDSDNVFHVRHAGFTLYPKEDAPDVQFSKVQEAARRLQSKIGKHGLQVRLIHNGFQLEKDREVEINVAETKELASRLMFMTGIDYRVGAYGMGPKKGVKPGWTNEINWKDARVSSSRPW